MEAAGKEKRKLCPTKRSEQKKEHRSFCLLLPFLFFWDDVLMRYRNGAGQLVTSQAVKQAVNTFTAKVQNQMGAIASQLVDGQIGLPEYHATMTQKVAAAHTAGYAAGRGGLQTIASGEETATVNYHLAKLGGFVADLQRGGISGEMTIARSRLYGASVSTSYEAGHYDGLKTIANLGIRIELKNVLGEAEHCMSRGGEIGCLDETERGWVPYEQMSLPGHRTCKGNCKCRLDHRIVQR